jgi:hypothetical protein
MVNDLRASETSRMKSVHGRGQLWFHIPTDGRAGIHGARPTVLSTLAEIVKSAPSIPMLVAVTQVI